MRKGRTVRKDILRPITNANHVSPRRSRALGFPLSNSGLRDRFGRARDRMILLFQPGFDPRFRVDEESLRRQNLGFKEFRRNGRPGFVNERLDFGFSGTMNGRKNL